MSIPKDESTPNLPDSIRLPLHSLQADIGYLFGRVAADESCAAAMTQSVRDRLDKIERSCNSLREALANLDKAADDFRMLFVDDSGDEPTITLDVDVNRVCQEFEALSEASKQARAALSTLPVNDRQTSDDVRRLRDALDLADHALKPFEDAAAMFAWPTFEIDQHAIAPGTRLSVGDLRRAHAARAALKATGRQTSDELGRLRDAARRAHDTLIEINQFNYTHADVCELNDASVEAILLLADAIGERHGKTEKWWNDRRAALKGVPQPASDDHQADASAPALSEKVNARSEWQPIESAPTEPMREVIIAGQYDNGIWYVEEGFRNPLGHWNGRKINPPTHWMPLPSPPGAELNFSNDADRDGVSLKSDTSSQPASEVRTEVTLQDRLRYGVPQATHTERRRAELQAAAYLDNLTDTLREIEKQCIQADDPEHHTLSLVKHLARHALARLPQHASEAGKLSTDEVLP